LEGLYAVLKVSIVEKDEISKDNLIHLFMVCQLVMELKNALWLDSEKSLEAERANSQKLKAALQVTHGEEGREWKSYRGSSIEEYV